MLTELEHPLHVHHPNTSAERIVELWRRRTNDRIPELQMAKQIRDIVDDEIVLPLPELSGMEEHEKPAVANLMDQGLQQMSRRTASVEPGLYFPSTNPGKDPPDADARDRSRVIRGWWQKNKLKRRISKRSRYFYAYGAAPVLILPDDKLGIPRYLPQDPLSVFPGDDVFDDMTPPDVITEAVHTYGGLIDMYGHETVARVSKPAGWDFQTDANNYETKFHVLTYMDDHEHTQVLVGYAENTHYPHSYVDNHQGEVHVTLRSTPNYAGRCLCIYPGAINLNRVKGHFDGMVGMYQAQATLMAMSIIGTRRSVWPREWVTSNPNESAQILATPDPGTGTPGKIQGGTIETQTLDPNFIATGDTMDRLEHAQRMTASIPSEFGGMSQSDNVRTGRRGQQVMGAAIDFTIAEAQDTFAQSLVEENKAAMAVDKTFFDTGSSKKFFFPTRSNDGSVTYTPSKLWSVNEHVVDYPIAGSDMQNLPIEGGQRIQMGTMSRRAFMEVDPIVKDAEAEQRQIETEQLSAAFFSSIQQLAAQPEGPFQPEHLVRLYRKIHANPNVFEAFIELQDEIEEEQARQPQTPADAQPGLNTPGQMAETGSGAPPNIPEPDASMQNLQQLLGGLGVQQQAQRSRQNPVG